MPKFKKKPVTIEAWQLQAASIDERVYGDAPGWLGDAIHDGTVEKAIVPGSNLVHLDIKTPEGIMRAGPEDWIIQGVEGEIYPCKPSIFEKTYDAVDA